MCSEPRGVPGTTICPMPATWSFDRVEPGDAPLEAEALRRRRRIHGPDGDDEPLRLRVQVLGVVVGGEAVLGAIELQQLHRPAEHRPVPAGGPDRREGVRSAVHHQHRCQPRLDYKERYVTSRPGWSDDYLIEAQAEIPIVQLWGDGLLASVDGLTGRLRRCSGLRSRWPSGTRCGP